MTIWFDVTNSIEIWRGGIVGIIRVELMLIKKLHKIDRNIKFSAKSKYGFREVGEHELKWIFDCRSIEESYSKYKRRSNKKFIKIGRNPILSMRHYLDRKKYKKSGLVYPYKDGDIVYSCGWFGSGKEDFFAKIKYQLPNLRLVYTVYDLVMALPKTRYFYKPSDVTFEKYLQWISSHCDAIVYGGKTAQIDTESYYKEKNFRIPLGFPIKFGSDIYTGKKINSISKIKEDHEIKGDYIIAVGSFDSKKNYRILYEAYCILALEKFEKLPEFIICGQQFSEKDLVRKFKENPLIKEKVKIFSPTDEELELLYQNCKFAVLPTLYEGWSLVLPEILDHGKLCLASKVEPLIEVGRDLAYYIDPDHPKEWAEAIKKFITEKEELSKYESRIKNNWVHITWDDFANDVYHDLIEIGKLEKDSLEKTRKEKCLFIDVSLLFYKGGISGIPRTELLLARYLGRMFKEVRYFSLDSGRYIELPKELLKETLGDSTLDAAVINDRNNITPDILSEEDYPFQKNDIVFSAGSGFTVDTYSDLIELHKRVKFKFVQLIYDFTPIVVPETHADLTIQVYGPFLKNTYELSDYIIYGGKTAQADGIRYQKAHFNKVTDSYALKLGCDIQAKKHSAEESAEILKKIGIKKDYLITVGTIQPRKNHEILYEAYIELLKDCGSDNLPQLIICGRPGWKIEDFMHKLSTDYRVKGKIIVYSPTDDELDVLYKNCKFTLLPSFYEGWSLTLPESLNYSKFCLASDVPPLREVGDGIIDYANPYDPVEWAGKIKFYINNPIELKKREELIKRKWKNITWRDCAKELGKELEDL